MPENILIVDDEQHIIDLAKLYLEQDGYKTSSATDGKNALQKILHEKPNLIVLDLILPEVYCWEVFRRVRAESDVPIIMLTARTTEADKLIGLDLGADDYITKPFSPREVVARVRAVLRRIEKDTPKGPTELHCRGLNVNFTRHEVRLDGSLVVLTLKEFKLLETLIREPGRVFSRFELLEGAFGFDYEGMERTVDVHVMNLRKKIEPNPTQPTYIQTVYGIGYKFAEDV